MVDGQLRSALGYVAGRAPRDRRYTRALAEKLAEFEAFLAIRAAAPTEATEP